MLLNYIFGAFALFAAVQLCSSDPDSAYQFSRDSLTTRDKWMASIPVTAHLYELSIPGTHDSGASQNDGWAVQCQSLTISQQLNGGIRAFDIRCRHVDNKFAIHHGAFFQGIWFDEVLSIMVNFLRTHPTETIFMRVKEEHDADGNNRSFNSTFVDYVSPYLSNFFFRPHPSMPIDLLYGQVRGKILILDDFSGSWSGYYTQWGIPWSRPSLQDDYHLVTNWDLYDKWKSVESYLNYANSNQGPDIFMNFLSGSGGSFPYFVASGHASPEDGAGRLATGSMIPSDYPDFPVNAGSVLFEGTNILTRERLYKYNKVGILFMDFPGDGIVGAIINRNPTK